MKVQRLRRVGLRTARRCDASTRRGDGETTASITGQKVGRLHCLHERRLWCLFFLGAAFIELRLCCCKSLTLPDAYMTCCKFGAHLSSRFSRGGDITGAHGTRVCPLALRNGVRYVDLFCPPRSSKVAARNGGPICDRRLSHLVLAPTLGCVYLQGPENAPPILLIHGFGASVGHFRKNFPVLVAEGYRVHAIDLLGFGASDKPKDVEVGCCHGIVEH